MRLGAVRASWVGAASLTVLGSAAVSAVVLSSAPVGPVAPAAAPARVTATYDLPPAPLVLSFPAEQAPPAAEPPRPPRTAPGASRAARTPRAPADPRCSGDGWEQRRGDAALASLRHPADARAVEVSFRPGRSDVLGLAHLETRRVEVFVRSCARESEALLRHVLAHEVGHVVDVTRMTPELREQWLAARGIAAGTPWYGCDRCTDFATPAGDFAETYAQWQRGGSDSRSELAPAATRGELADLAARFF